MEQEYSHTLKHFALDGKPPEPQEFFGLFDRFLAGLDTARTELRSIEAREQEEEEKRRQKEQKQVRDRSRVELGIGKSALTVIFLVCRRRSSVALTMRRDLLEKPRQR